MRDRGNIYYDLRLARKTPQSERLFRVYILTEEISGSVLAWAIMQPRVNPKYTDFQCYVRASCRRRGYGARLYNKAAKEYGGKSKLVVHRHDDTSIAFFNSIGARR